MPVVTVRVDEEAKKRMEAHVDVNWSEVIRRAIAQKLAEEEEWRKIDVERRRQASVTTDSLRRRIPGWESVKEIRRWREREVVRR